VERFRSELVHGGDYDARELEGLVRRLGVAAMPGLLRYAEGKLPSAHLGLSAVVSPRVAPFHALLLAKGKKKETSESWLLAYPEVACIGLVPAALEKRKKTLRDAAAGALRFLASSGHSKVIAKAADRYGVREATDGMLVDDRPARVKPLPALLIPDSLRSHGSRPIG
jgi:hypothetical protein